MDRSRVVYNRGIGSAIADEIEKEAIKAAKKVAVPAIELTIIGIVIFLMIEKIINPL